MQINANVHVLHVMHNGPWSYSLINSNIHKYGKEKWIEVDLNKTWKAIRVQIETLTTHRISCDRSSDSTTDHLSPYRAHV